MKGLRYFKIILPVLGIIWGCSGSEKVELSKEGKLVEKMAEATYEVINSWEQLLKTMEMSTVWDLGYGLKDMIEYQIKNGGSGEKLFKELSDSTTPIGSTYRMAVDNMARGFLASDVFTEEYMKNFFYCSWSRFYGNEVMDSLRKWSNNNRYEAISLVFKGLKNYIQYVIANGDSLAYDKAESALLATGCLLVHIDKRGLDYNIFDHYAKLVLVIPMSNEALKLAAKKLKEGGEK